MATTNARVSELDFDQIKANLKDYLKSQEQFSDFDFEGSGISQLLNILSLNTHYNAYLANAVFNEGFLDTAIKRASVVSRASGFGYVPASAKCASAIVDVQVLNPDVVSSYLTLDKFTPFTSSIGGETFTFYTLETQSVPLVDNAYTFSDVKLYAGSLVSHNFVFDGRSRSFVIPNEYVDLDTLQVLVQKSATDTFTEAYQFKDDVVDVTGESKVFFVKENASERYELYFGDGALGKALDVGNIVKITYLVSSLNAPNVSSSKFTQGFQYNGSIGGNSNIVVNTIQNSIGGRDKEDIDSIKFNAPLAFARNKRIITPNDYLEAITRQTSTVEAVSVWGGEDNDPPTYGRVFISLKPFDGYVITEEVKNDIKNNILNKQGNRLVTPVFVEPEYLYVALDVKVKYDAYRTALSADAIGASIANRIHEYFNVELSKYQKKFYFSKLSRMIDDANDAVVGNLITLNMQKRITFPYNFAKTIDVTYSTPIKAGSISSNVFTYTTKNEFAVTATLVDDGVGNISVRKVDNQQIIAANIGTINYQTGRVRISDFVINSLLGGVEDIRINAAPQNAVTDVETSRNQIILLDDSTENGLAGITSGLTVSVAIQ